MKLNNVIITGGTGTFGRAFAKRCLKDGVERVCIYSRDELKQAEMRVEFNDPRMRFFIGDVRDLPRLKRALEGIDLVIHAAALKRVEVGEFDPGEMVKTNVLGTMNLIEAAHDCKVKKVIALSTDKAEEPVNVYGCTKLLMEKLLLNANRSPQFSVVRCGNFFGSRGSVLPIWKALKEKGDKVPLTDKKCTRYMMTVDEAVVLVLGMIERMPRLMVPKLKAFRPIDLARAMDVEYYITGLNPGERLHEIMNSVSSLEADRLTITELKCLLNESSLD
jgi:UDP-N-acetylglucosamine 4,6-dehydratase